MNDQEFKQAIENQKWTFAKTYAKTAPHEYFLRTANEELFAEIKRRIAELGVEEMFYNKKEKYYYFEGFKYWGYQLVLNRTNDMRIYK